jgi:hypothetical protein
MDYEFRTLIARNLAGSIDRLTLCVEDAGSPAVPCPADSPLPVSGHHMLVLAHFTLSLAPDTTSP